MNGLPPLDPGEFEAFFQAVHGYPPFPWQTRLARQVTTNGWPPVLDLPTGSGKTAAVDVAVFALALDAGRPERNAPLRIVYVVDRRTIVDQAYERARLIRGKLAAGEADITRRVGMRLRQFAHAGGPLRLALLRGGIARDDGWARSPDQPLIAVSTVDQVGSRLLFRGYGISDSMKPVHAGLLGNDVLYLLDEVHLSQPFRETLGAISERYRSWARRAVAVPFVVVEMSATPSAGVEQPFRLDESDWRHTVLGPRLRAAKPASLSSAPIRTFVKEIERQVLPVLDRPGATVAVVVNRVKTARELHRHLLEIVRERGGRVRLLTGRMRPFDRDELEDSLLPRIRSGRKRSPDDSPVVVVATQSIEAGADFDFDALVTECASLDALRQRFGRLDRLGELDGGARGAIVARADTLKDDAVYGDAIGKTWEWLREVADGDAVDFGIEALTVPEDAFQRGLLAPKAHAPVLLPAHLDAWAQTAPIPDPDPEIALWLHGPQSGPADVQLIWRADLTEELLGAALDEGSDAREVALGIVDALPPVSAEAMSVPFVAAKRWLSGKAEPDASDVEGASLIEEESDRDAGSPRPVVVWQGDQSKVDLGSEIAPGQTLVVPSAYGGISQGNWDPGSTAPVQDVAELAHFRQRARPVLRLHEAVIARFYESGEAPEAPRPTDDDEAPSDRDLVFTWLERNVPPEPIRTLWARLIEDRRVLRVERVRSRANDADGAYFVVSGKRRAVSITNEKVEDESATTEPDTSPFAGAAITLSSHQAGVADTASRFAERIGLRAEIVSDLRLAGIWHDVGKSDRRFQRWLHGGSEFKALVQREPLAKSAVRLPTRAARTRARERAGYPKGGRHELMSLALLESANPGVAGQASDWDLVRHLVASHHGYGRALAPWVPDPHPVLVAYTHDGIRCQASSAHELGRFDSGIAERYWHLTARYGWWGLALLETILRLADHLQSAGEGTGATPDA